MGRVRRTAGHRDRQGGVAGGARAPRRRAGRAAASCDPRREGGAARRGLREGRRRGRRTCSVSPRLRPSSETRATARRSWSPLWDTAITNSFSRRHAPPDRWSRRHGNRRSRRDGHTASTTTRRRQRRSPRALGGRASTRRWGRPIVVGRRDLGRHRRRDPPVDTPCPPDTEQRLAQFGRPRRHGSLRMHRSRAEVERLADEQAALRGGRGARRTAPVSRGRSSRP